jgi:hypothetical protein
MNGVLLVWDVLWASKVGQALLSFLRVAGATVLACWVDAGMPLSTLTGADLVVWVELGVQAGAGLVLLNYLGPWEKRYGRGSKDLIH